MVWIVKVVLVDGVQGGRQVGECERVLAGGQPGQGVEPLAGAKLPRRLRAGQLRAPVVVRAGDGVAVGRLLDHVVRGHLQHPPAVAAAQHEQRAGRPLDAPEQAGDLGRPGTFLEHPPVGQGERDAVRVVPPRARRAPNTSWLARARPASFIPESSRERLGTRPWRRPSPGRSAGGR